MKTLALGVILGLVVSLIPYGVTSPEFQRWLWRGSSLLSLSQENLQQQLFNLSHQLLAIKYDSKTQAAYLKGATGSALKTLSDVELIAEDKMSTYEAGVNSWLRSASLALINASEGVIDAIYGESLKYNILLEQELNQNLATLRQRCLEVGGYLLDSWDPSLPREAYGDSLLFQPIFYERGSSEGELGGILCLKVL
ncbi:MAG: hypothetical protein R2880_05775 [Deinococcales bacterium]